jgi:p-aminobenzoyl-glutamate transporter AbgT
MISQIVTAVEEAGLELPFPSFVFGIIAMATFILLGVITYSYRDVANRHDHKSSNNSAHH